MNSKPATTREWARLGKANQVNPYKWEVTDDSMKALLKANNIHDRSSIDRYRKLNRFGCLDPYNRLGITREYLFFTKPDLHLVEPGTLSINPQLSSIPFFVDSLSRYPYVVQSLQKSAKGDSSMRKQPFICILTNAVKNTLDLDDLSVEDVESAANSNGTKIMYGKHSWAGDDNYDFSLEFEDTKYLEIYQLAKAYDEYRRLSRFGLVDAPNINNAPVSASGYNYNSYCKNKEMHDTFGIYKFITDEDYSTIIYAAYLTGVYIKNVPRSAFSDINQGDPLKYSLQFHAFNVCDSDPRIFDDFNKLILDSYGTKTAPGKDFPIYNSAYKMVDGDWALVPYIERVYKSKLSKAAWDSSSGMEYKYKLTWRK